MKNSVCFLAVYLILTTSCTKPVEKADEIFTDEGTSFLGNEIVFFSSTIDFYHHGVLSNYWYSDDATYKEILDDKYHEGYRGLTKLNEKTKYIDTKDQEVSVAVNNLEKEIEIAKKDLKKKQKLLESLDSFGGLSFSGSDILRLSNDSDQEKDSQVPPNVKKSFDALLKLLDTKYFGVAESIFNLERRAFMISEPSDEEKSQIRANLKIFIQNKINEEYKEDNQSKKEMANLLFNIFEKEHPINYAY